jgi:hypothetical protein
MHGALRLAACRPSTSTTTCLTGGGTTPTPRDPPWGGPPAGLGSKKRITWLTCTGIVAADSLGKSCVEAVTLSGLLHMDGNGVSR